MALLPIKKILKINKIPKKLFPIFFTFVFCLLIPGLCCFADYKPNSLFSKDCQKEYKEFVVKHVFDGDTILLNNNKKIRLLGIDAYEHDQASGKSAKDFLTKLLLNKNVCIETDVQEKDKYERTLGYVFSNTKFINEELLKSGNALLYDFPPNIKYIKKLKKAQIYARQNMLGIWKENNYILETPSQHRHKTN